MLLNWKMKSYVEGETSMLTASYHDTFTVHGNIKDVMISKQRK